MRFCRYIIVLVWAVLSSCAWKVAAQELSDSTLRARLVSGLESLQRELPPLLQTDSLEVAAEPILFTPAEDSAPWRSYMEKVDRVAIWLERMQQFSALVASKRQQLDSLSEEAQASLLREIELLEALQPLLEGELLRLVEERDAYERAFVGGRKGD